MAKQRDDHKGPDEDPKGQKPKGKPQPDPLEDELDALDEIADAAEIVEEPSTPPGKPMPNMSLEKEELPEADIVEDAEEIAEADEVIMADVIADAPPAAVVVEEDLFAEEVEAPSDAGRQVADVVEEAEEVAEAEEVSEAEEVEDADDVSDAEEVEEEAGSPLGEAAALDFLTAEDLGDEKSGPGVKAPPPEPVVEAAEEVEEAFDFAGAHEALEAGKPKVDSAVDLGGKETSADRPSGVDELAEALESGVDLHQDVPGPKMPEEEIDLNAMMNEDESSAVDLGAPAKDKPLSHEDLSGEAEEPPMSKAKSAFDDDDADKIGEAAEEAEEVAEEAEEVAEEAEEVAEEPEEAVEEAEEAAEVAEEADEVVDEADEATEIQDDLSKAFDEQVDQVKAGDEATEVDDEAAKIFDQADDEATMAWKGEKAKEESEEADEATEEASDAVEDEEPVVKPKGKADKKKPARAAAEEEEEEEDAGRGGTAVARKARKPKYMRRWFGGFMLALIMICGAAAGIWYLAPDQLDEWLAFVPPSPRDQNKVSIIGHIDEYKKAKRDLAGANDTVAKLKKEQDEKAIELKKAIGKNEELVKKISGLEDSDKVAKEVAKLIDQADLNKLPKAIADFMKDKQKIEKLIDGIATSLNIDADKLDLGTFKKIVKEFSESKNALAAINKKLDDAKFKDVDSLLAFKKDIEDKLTAVNKELADAMVKDPGAKGVQQLIASRKKLEADRDNLESAIATAYKELADAKLAPEKGDPRKLLLDGVKLARLKVESPLVVPLGQLANSMSGLGTGTAGLIERTFDLAALLTEVNYYRIREPFVQTPVKQLDTWLALLQDRQFNNSLSLDAAAKDSAWVRSKEAGADKEAKAKALYVSALILRNQEKYAQARDLLEKTNKEIAGLKNIAWANLANQSLKELTDSGVYYLPRADKLKELGNLKGALEILNTGLKAIPDDGRLLARRSLLRLELARPQGKLAADSQKDIRQDAEAATKDAAAAAEAFFALGQLEETLGQWAKAEDDYRAALKSHKGNAEEASRYRIALARMLLMHDRPPAPLEEPPAKEKEKDAGAESSLRSSSALRTLLLMVMTGVQPGADDEETPEAKARLKESIELAKELIKSDNPKTKGQGYMLLGQAYSKQGLRTKGLQEYVKGLQLLNPGLASKDLDKLVQEHPAFQQPDSLERPNPYLAERYFGRGLHYYWEKKYPEAEKQFMVAIGYYKKDPRYHYYLGLSRLPQKGKLKRDGAIFAFEQGARLEQENPQSSYEVNASLERLQGPLRIELNRYRQKEPE
jgi:tetratricopeptide (TPR) repeat protein